MIHPDDARRKGFTIDTYVYPWHAYKGDRFRPTEWQDCYTDLESETMKALEILRLSVARVAQAAEIETAELPVLEGDVFALTKQPRGWNRLCAWLVDAVRVTQ